MGSFHASEFFLYDMIASEKGPKTLSEFLDLKGDEQKQEFEKKSVQKCKPELQVNLNILTMPIIYFIELLLSHNGLVCPQPGIIAAVVNSIILYIYTNPTTSASGSSEKMSLWFFVTIYSLMRKVKRAK